MNWQGLLLVNVLLCVAVTFIGYPVIIHIWPELADKEGVESLMFVGCIVGAYSYDIRKLHGEIEMLKGDEDDVYWG